MTHSQVQLEDATADGAGAGHGISAAAGAMQEQEVIRLRHENERLRAQSEGTSDEQVSRDTWRVVGHRCTVWVCHMRGRIQGGALLSSRWDVCST